MPPPLPPIPRGNHTRGFCLDRGVKGQKNHHQKLLFRRPKIGTAAGWATITRTSRRPFALAMARRCLPSRTRTTPSTTVTKMTKFRGFSARRAGVATALSSKAKGLPGLEKCLSIAPPRLKAAISSTCHFVSWSAKNSENGIANGSVNTISEYESHPTPTKWVLSGA